MHRNCQPSAGLDLPGHSYPYRRSADSAPPRADARAFAGIGDPQPIRDRARRPLKKVRPRIAPGPDLTRARGTSARAAISLYVAILDWEGGTNSFSSAKNWRRAYPSV